MKLVEEKSKNNHSLVKLSTVYLESKEVYTGEWLDGVREGKGNCIDSMGNEYYGDWKGDRKEGEGILKLYNGDIYKGGFANDVAEGYGEYYCGEGESGYRGEWKANEYHGKGSLRLEDGTVLKGWFEHGKKNGDFEIESVDRLIKMRGMNDCIEGEGRIEFKNGMVY